MKHLASEFKKSLDLLSCDYEYWIASDTFRGAGYVIAATENKAILLRGVNDSRLTLQT